MNPSQVLTPEEARAIGLTVPPDSAAVHIYGGCFSIPVAKDSRKEFYAVEDFHCADCETLPDIESLKLCEEVMPNGPILCEQCLGWAQQWLITHEDLAERMSVAMLSSTPDVKPLIALMAAYALGVKNGRPW